MTSWTDDQQQRLRECHDEPDIYVGYWCSDACGRPANGGDTAMQVEPGDMQTIDDDLTLEVCPDRENEGGLHATQYPHRWKGDRVWVVALHPPFKIDHGKRAARRREIIGEIQPSDVMSSRIAARLGISLGINLKGAELEGASFSRANLQHADLKHANFQRANLPYADFRSSCLDQAVLKHANLSHGNFDHADLYFTDLEYAKLRNAKFRQASIDYAKFRYSDLKYTHFQKANLAGSKFCHADLRYTNFHKANLRCVDLRGANLENACLKDAVIDRHTRADIDLEERII